MSASDGNGQGNFGRDAMLIRGDARVLPLQDGCVQTCVTSPPYFGLRDYGTATWDGGDADCDHTRQSVASRSGSGLDGATTTQGGVVAWRETCGRCGAARIDRQIGLEASPAVYVAALVAVFREVWRVLKDDGTLWLNLGDSYAGGGGAGSRSAIDKPDLVTGGRNRQARNAGSVAMVGRVTPCGEAKPKDLLGMPWRVAFALQADGWYLRSDIIWAKPNPMPESVTDRCTKAHEYLFMLSKSQRYYFDAATIAEPVSDAMLMEVAQGYDGLGAKDYESAGVQNPSTVKARIIAGARLKAARDDSTISQGPMSHHLREARDRNGRNAAPFGLTRNKRDVWTIPTLPYAGAHFATMPEALVEPCILAGCPLGGLVLDPFVGSGTVVSVAERLGRRGVGVDLSYQDLSRKRTAQRGLRFGEATA